MTKLEKAKEIIKENAYTFCCGIFNCRNIAGDEMDTLYEDENILIDVCYYWQYFEVFGLSKEEFKELENYYYNLIGYEEEE